MLRFLTLFFAFACGAIMMALIGPNDRSEAPTEPVSLILSQEEGEVAEDTRREQEVEFYQSEKSQTKARIAIVIDDLGDNIRTEDVIALNMPLTMAFLPDDKASPRLSVQAAEKGHDVLVHMPMQSKGYENREQTLLKKDMSEAEIKELLRYAFARVPAAKGLNNHTGSAFTEYREGMRVVLDYARENSYLYLDSKTTAASVAQSVSDALEYPILTRHVFLDHFEEIEMVEKALVKTQEIAEMHGVAIAIGHPKPNTLQALKSWAQGLDNTKFELVGIYELKPHIAASPMAKLSTDLN